MVILGSGLQNFQISEQKEEEEEGKITSFMGILLRNVPRGRGREAWGTYL